MKTIVIGASSGIGLAVSSLLTEQGIEVLGVGKRANIDKCSMWKYISLDVSMVSASKIFEHVGADEVNNIVYTVGVNDIRTVKNIERSALSRLFEINFFPFVDICKTYIDSRSTLRETSIVCIGSIWSSFGLSGRSMYGATKGAMAGFVRHLSAEVKAQGCLVNTLSPGFTDTGLTSLSISDPLLKHAFYRQSDDLMDAKGVAKHIIDLLRPNNNYITGQEIFVDMGFSSHA